MRAARLRHRLQLQQETRVADSYGGSTPTWSTTATVWGAVETLYGYESQTADQMASATQVKIIIRYATEWKTISAKWRIKDARTLKCYDIHAVVQPDQRAKPNTIIEMYCSESQKDDE